MIEYVDPDKVRALQSNIKYGTPSQWDNEDTILLLCNYFLTEETRAEQLDGVFDYVADADLIDNALEMAKELKGSEKLVEELEEIRDTLEHSSDCARSLGS